MNVAVLTMLCLAGSPATDAFLKAEAIPVSAAATLPAFADRAAWDKLPSASVPLAPQLAIALQDKAANAARTDKTPRTVTVRAAASATELAVLLEWADATEDKSAPDATDAYPDGIAVELPQRFGAGQRLPYVGMGDAGAPVLVHFVRAEARQPVVRTAVAAGFGSLTRATLPGTKAWLKRTDDGTGWRALFVRPLVTGTHDINAALVPIAFAVWDGAREQRGGNKLLSAWRVLELPGRAPDATYLAELAWGYGPGETGDPARGKAFVDAVCTSCHRIGDKAMAPLDLGPELTNVGVVSSYAYLRDSLLAPSSVLVPSLNKNRHYNKGAPRDAHGAYPHADLGQFAAMDANGQPISKMPSFAQLPKEQLADVIAYLKTLGATP